MMDTSNTVGLGHFLDFNLWQQALRLLQYQVESQASNRHFRTLSMIYYRELAPAVGALDSADYFENKVANNLFYGLEREFAVDPYIVPKKGLGLRNYKFFTYPMRVLYYAIGLYLVRLSEEFLQNFYNKRKQVGSYYGGKLHFEGKDLQLTKNNIYFKSYYTDFRNRVRRETQTDVDNKIVIRLDIQNYYDNVSVPTLLRFLDRSLKPSFKATLTFDTTTREQIVSFFRYISHNGTGIPQADNSLISSFIGHLYLVFGDLLVEEEIYEDQEVIKEYSVTRYVDDTFISITFRDDVGNRSQQEYAESLGARIADRLYYELGLRFNPKTRFFCLGDEHQLQELLDTLKKVSPEYHGCIDHDDEPPASKIDNIFDELSKLKESSIQPTSFEHELQDEILKEVFDKQVAQMLDMKENIKRIHEVFRDFDFNHVKEYPLPMIIMILKSDETAQDFRNFLFRKSKLTTRDVDLILTYLCQIDLKDPKLLDRLRQYPPMARIISTVISADLSSDVPGYYDLVDEKIREIAAMPYVIEQIRHRVYNERHRSYSLALNHLLNEIHAVCYQLGNHGSNGSYNANAVVDFLNSKMVPPDVCISIRNLFDRRNTNQISHPGSEENVTWAVTADEYFEYRSQVGRCLSMILAREMS